MVFKDHYFSSRKSFIQVFQVQEVGKYFNLNLEFQNWKLGMLNKVADAGSLVTRVFQLLLQFFQKHLVVRQSVFRSIIAVLGYLYKRNINNTVVTAWNLFDEDGFNLITRLPVTPGDV